MSIILNWSEHPKQAPITRILTYIFCFFWEKLKTGKKKRIEFKTSLLERKTSRQLNGYPCRKRLGIKSKLKGFS